MNRIMILAMAALVVVAGMSVTQEANAGLFGGKNKCCKTQKCSKPKKCRQGLFAKRKAKKCCEQTCCAPEPTCCEAAPVCAAPAPAPCGCAPVIATPACGCAAAPAPSCGCEVASTCGCDAAPACGCETTNCNCLSKRKLRRANRKGECCGAKADSCNTCSTGTCGAAVQTVSYAAPIAEGCSSCGSAAPVVEGCSSCSGETVIESAPEEAAPEAPESTT